MRGRPKNINSWTTYNCELCGKEVTKRTCDYNKSKNHYCSHKCYADSISGEGHYHYKAEIVQCEYCGKDIERNQSRLKAQKKQFCNADCHHKWMKDIGPKGKDHPVFESIEVECANCNNKIYRTPYDIERSNYLYCGRDCMIEHRRKIGFYNGENNKNWNGGVQKVHLWVRNLPESREWRCLVIERDNNRCQCCGGNTDLNVHHIENFGDLYLELDDKLWDVDNGITLCNDCHRVFHSQFGNRNNNLIQIKNFLGYAV